MNSLSGDLETTQHLVAGLHTALEISIEAVTEGIEKTRQEMAEIQRRDAEEVDRAWRASFKSHAYFNTERTRPTSIALCGFAGRPERWLRLDLDLMKSPLTFARQALVQARAKTEIPFFWKDVINYSPDRAVCFDLEGRPIDVLPKAWKPGEMTVQIGRRPVSNRELKMLLGGSS